MNTYFFKQFDKTNVDTTDSNLVDINSSESNIASENSIPPIMYELNKHKINLRSECYYL